VWRDIRSHAAASSAVVVIKFIANSYRSRPALSRMENAGMPCVKSWRTGSMLWHA